MTKNFAHRGFSGKYPENTILAFQKALDEGVDGIEFDVHLTRDKELVIIHDETLERTTNGTGRVVDHTLDELKKLDASAGFPRVYGINPIPTLEEYFELIKGKEVITNIEIKTGIIWYEGIEKQVLDILDRYDRRGDTIISSFNHFSVLRMKELAPDIKCGFLEESRIIKPADYCEKYGVECYHPMWCDMTPDVVAELKAKNIEINVWTTNTVEIMEDMIAKNVDSVITNFPDLYNQVRKNHR